MELYVSAQIAAQRIQKRIVWASEVAGDTICGDLKPQLLDFDTEQFSFSFLCQTAESMRNPIGTLHGGCAATVADQVMGCVANCLYTDGSSALTSQLQLYYHRPLTAGQPLTARVWVVSVSQSLIHLRAEVSAAEAPQQLAVSSTAVFFRKTGGSHESCCQCFD